MKGIFDYMMVYPPNYIKRNESKQNDKLDKSFPTENMCCNQEKYSSGKKKQIVKSVLVYFLMDVFY